MTYLNDFLLIAGELPIMTEKDTSLGRVNLDPTVQKIYVALELMTTQFIPSILMTGVPTSK